MLNKQQEIDTIKNLMLSDFVFNIANNYGITGTNNLKIVLEIIPHVFKNLNLKNFSSIYIFKSDVFNFPDVENICNVQSYDHITTISGPYLIIRINKHNDLSVCSLKNDFDTSTILKTDFVYQYKNGEDIFHTKEKSCTLPIVSGSDSWFTIATFKDLEDALSHYKTTTAKYASCLHIEKAMFTEDRIFFKPQPEHFLRDSLVSFLKDRLRGEGLEIRPEQIVDTSHPVDIKVSWGCTNHIALIEVKWIGKSLNIDTAKFITYSDARAREGAKQLADYLEANKQQVPNHNTVGYLVVFDLRRKGTNKNTNVINRKNGLWYKNKEVNYKPKYHSIRKDFAIPIRMFIEPRCIDENQ